LRPCSGEAGANPGVFLAEFGAEVEALLEVGLTRGEFGPDREVPAPGRAAAGHGDLHPGLIGECEEGGAGRRQAGEQVRRDTVAGDVEEAVRAAGRLDLPRHLGEAGWLRGYQRRHVDDREGSERITGGHDSHCAVRRH
jgi:hypothetical protein